MIDSTIQGKISKELNRRWEVHEKMANRKIFFEKMAHGLPGKIIGTLGVIFSLYIGEEYMRRNIPGLQRAYDNFISTIELAPEMLGIKHEDYDKIPSINDLYKPTEEQRRNLQDFLYDQYQPTLQ